MTTYQKHLENIFIKVREAYKPSEIEFFHSMGAKGAGLCFMKIDDHDDRFLSLTVLAPFAFFDKGKSTFQDRAAVLFMRYIKGLIEIALREEQIINDPDVAGIWILMSWSTIDDQEVKRGEGFTLIATKEDCRDFTTEKIPAQDFVSRASITGMQEGKELGKISIAVGPTMKVVNTREKKGFAFALYEAGTELIVANKPRLAMSYFDRAVELYPNYSEAYYFRGSVNSSLSMRDPARNDLEKALQTTKTNGFKDFIRAALAALNGDQEESCRLLTSAIASGFESETGIGIGSSDISSVLKHDANFDGIRSARCYKQIIRQK
jgi:tetratricopeptide (TPR) repeat protein